MLIIRDEQMAVLRQYMTKQYEDKVLGDVRELFPGQYEEMGAPATREVIRQGTKASAEYGIVRSADVARFIYLMFFVSHDFYKNPDYPWAADILNQEDLDPTAKMDKLYELSEEQIERLENQRKYTP